MPLSEIQPGPGTLLIAPPMMHDPNFRRAVVLLCEHGPEGSFGLILNRPLTLSLSDVLQGVDDHAFTVDLGGPVQRDTLHFIHRHGDLVPGAVSVLGNIYWGGDFDIVKTLLDTRQAAPADLRFFLGYAGWSPGQLVEEIEQGGWILAHADEAAIFSCDAEGLWRMVLRRMGGEYALLSNFPEDPRMN